MYSTNSYSLETTVAQDQYEDITQKEVQRNYRNSMIALTVIAVLLVIGFIIIAVMSSHGYAPDENMSSRDARLFGIGALGAMATPFLACAVGVWMIKYWEKRGAIPHILI